MKTLLITGASSGIGAATAQLAATQGYRVIACGRQRARLESLAAQHSNIRTLSFDITQPSECQQALAKVRADIIILNAGVCEYVDVDTWEAALFKRVFDANFFGAVNCLQVLLPTLERGNQLIVIDSLARLLPFSRSQAYGASKAALFYLTKSLDVDLRGRGIRVQSISPGFVKTPLTDKNTFSMPMRISADDAAQAILTLAAKGQRNGFFPTLFALIIRTLAMLPVAWQVALCRKMKNSEDSSI